MCRIHGVVNALPGLSNLFVTRNRILSMLCRFIVVFIHVDLRHPNSILILQNSNECVEMTHREIKAPEKIKLIKEYGVDPIEF